MSVLTERAGPLPVWGWGVAGIGALLAVIIIAHKKAGSTTTPAQTQAAADLAAATPAGFSAGQGTDLFSGADSLSAQLQAIQQQLANLQAQSSTGRTFWNSDHGLLSFGPLSGFAAPTRLEPLAPGSTATALPQAPISTNSFIGSGYFAFTDPTKAAAYGAAGGQSYWSPSPGVFKAVTSWSQVPQGSTIYGHV